jgi:uncharacterized protein
VTNRSSDAVAASLMAIRPLQPIARAGTTAPPYGMRLARPAWRGLAPRPLCALLIMHEFQHVKLGAVLGEFDLYDPADRRLFHVP